MQVKALVRMAHNSTLYEAGEEFAWHGEGKPPAALCEPVKGSTQQAKTKDDAFVSYADSMADTQKSKPVK